MVCLSTRSKTTKHFHWLSCTAKLKCEYEVVGNLHLLAFCQREPKGTKGLNNNKDIASSHRV